MARLSELQPRERKLVIDLVREAGVDVGDWSNWEGGEKNAGANPKYCYDWSFVQPKKVVVLNLWFESIQERNGTIECDVNLREAARKAEGFPNYALRVRRSRKMDDAIRDAFRDRLRVRVIVLDGRRQTSDDPRPSRVAARLLDTEPWAVVAYDQITGQAKLVRGAYSSRFVDQFSPEVESALRRAASGEAFVRSVEVRKTALLRAKGRCEWCGELGFKMMDGRIFLETHHVIPLEEDGPDTTTNVVAICPNHHREAHYGENKDRMREELLRRVAKRQYRQ